MLPPRLARFVAASAAALITTASAPLCAQLPPPPSDDEVVVRLDGDKVVLEEDSDDTEWHTDWAKVCESPCNVAVPLHAIYRVEGPGIRPSAPFHLQGRAGDIVTVHVTAAESANFYIGATTTIAGGATTTVGAVGLLVSAFFDNFSVFGEEDRPTRNTKTPWIATTCVGVAVLSAGLVIMLSNRRTPTSQVARSVAAGRGAFMVTF